ncbi:hypothetical protein BGX28_005644 [Mortierella sp. GBA30]|nr:hypothetical protein BGX28_005644 [Mortierella sp. GBA30]
MVSPFENMSAQEMDGGNPPRLMSITISDDKPLTQDQERELERERLLRLVRYDTSSKQRVPSWTDRILWKSTGGNFYLPAEIGDDTRSGHDIEAKERSLLKKKNRPKEAASKSPLSLEQEGQSRESLRDVKSSVAGVTSGGGGPGSILKLRKKSTSAADMGMEYKPGLFESLKMEFQSHTAKSSRKSSERHGTGTDGSGRSLLSEEDEARDAVLVKQYTAHHEMGLFSDHRPVTAVFAVRFDWNLTDRGVIGGDVHKGDGNRWSPLDKVLDRMPKIVSSTIIRPDIESNKESATSGRKRSLLPESTESNSRPRTSITSRLSGLSGSQALQESSTSKATTATTTIAADVSDEPSSTSMAASKESNEPQTENTTTMMEEGEVDENNHRSKRARQANPAEDAKRGRRMMGMILGTLGQFKKQQQQLQQGSNGSTDNPSVSSGLASREALQKRVQEKLQRERELNEERRKKELEERRTERAEMIRQRVLQQQQRGAGVRSGRGEAKWENGYILTETRPQLRYMPKVLNDTTRRRMQEQNKDRDEKKMPSNSSSNSKTENTSRSTELDVEGDMAVDEDVVVDVKEREHEQKEDEALDALKSPVSGASSVTVPASPTKVPASTNAAEDVTGDVDMALAASTESAEAEGGGSTANKENEKETADASAVDDASSHSGSKKDNSSDNQSHQP